MKGVLSSKVFMIGREPVGGRALKVPMNGTGFKNEKPASRKSLSGDQKRRTAFRLL